MIKVLLIPLLLATNWQTSHTRGVYSLIPTSFVHKESLISEGSPIPYSFGYVAEGDGTSSHHESSDGSGNVKGSYSLNIKDGRRRKVDYTADFGGFKAKVDTNEPGTKSDSPAEVSFHSSAPQLVSIPSGGHVTSYQTGLEAGGAAAYGFSYTSGGVDGSSSHEESSDGAGNVRGSYSLSIKDGRRRKVDYTADTGGFKAKVDTNEPGTKSDNPADVSFHSSAPQIAPVGVPAAPVSYIPGAPAIPVSYIPGVPLSGNAVVSFQGGFAAGEGAPSPYSFGYAAEGPDGGSAHQETSDGAGNVRGSYSLKVNDGRRRKVDYTADAGGFKAKVDTNEPGTKSDSPAEVSFHSSAPEIVPVGGPVAAVPYVPAPVPAPIIPGSAAVAYSSGIAVDGAPAPYAFNYAAEGIDGGSAHQETSDGAGNVRGSYSLKVKDGRRRKVDYTADAGGFKATVDTNEPGTKSDNPADVSFRSSAPQIAPVAGVPGAPAQYIPAALSGGGAVISFQGGLAGGEGAPSPYSFSYAAEGSDGGSAHQETSDGAGNVRGSYSLKVNDGRRRKVDYTADAGGFKAKVDTNEPGTKSDSPAEVSFHSSAPVLAPVGGPIAPVPYIPAAIHAPIVPGVPAGGAVVSYSGGFAAGEGAPSPYSFSYAAEGTDGGSAHQETSDGAGNVRGSYSLKVNDGRRRKVDYTADAGGFKAKVDTNEPGTKSHSPAEVLFHSSAPDLAPVGVPVAPVPYIPAAIHAPIVPGVPAGGAVVSYSGGIAASEGAPTPYAFNYAVDGIDGGSSHQETSDGAGNVRGSYSLKVNDGRRRKVDYTADAGGFKAKVDTNEPGTKSDSPADASFYSSAPQVAPVGVPAAPAAYIPAVPSSGGAAISFQGGIGAEGAPSPYSFSYAAEGPDGGSAHQETSDGAGNVRGSYALKVKDGRRRKVDYTADAGGFKAKVDTNEPGTKSHTPAEVSFYSSAPELAPVGEITVSAPITLTGSGVFYQGGIAAEGAPKPYAFGYKAQGIDGSSSHQESSDGSGNVKGTYSLSIKDGRSRKVDYTADVGGFKARVDTNEPGTKSDSPAEVSFHSSSTLTGSDLHVPVAAVKSIDFHTGQHYLWSGVPVHKEWGVKSW